MMTLIQRYNNVDSKFIVKICFLSHKQINVTMPLIKEMTLNKEIDRKITINQRYYNVDSMFFGETLNQRYGFLREVDSTLL